MADTLKLEVANGDLVAALEGFLATILKAEGIDAILAPQHLPMRNMVMPVLTTDPERLHGLDPLAPVFALNSAKIASKLSRKTLGGQVAVVMRPCEIRAFVELVKLKQGHTDELIIIGTDCLGAFKNTDYSRWAEQAGPGATAGFVQNALAGQPVSNTGLELSPACRVCEFPIPDGADILIGLLGIDTTRELLVQAQSQKGRELLDRLGLPPGQEPAGRAKAVSDLVSLRSAQRDRMFEATRELTGNLEKLSTYLAGCVNCYNCRVACPVCYCRECVFVTDVFDHEPLQYLRWANRKGAIKMPTDTVFYHLTRLTHMSTACVGCGQCSNACPNDIPVMELFRTVAQGAQAAFEYQAGRSLDEAPPLSVFRENEFMEITGGRN
jgi:formate dehydrogenase subunit beta